MNKTILKTLRGKMKLQNVQLQIVLNIFILNVLKSMIQKNCLSILIQIRFTLGVLYIIVMFVVSVETQCLSFNV